MTNKPTGVATRPLSIVAAAIMVVALGNALLVGCGGGNKSTESSSSTPSSSTPAATAPGDTGAAAGGATAATPAGFDPAATFQQKCSPCHGPQGRGDGPAGAALNPHPRNYHDHAYMQTRTDQELHDSVFNGKSQMPAWGKTGQLTDAQVWAMVKYVRQLGSTP
jgi:mono/diheme cytochrome c family protein